MIPGLGRSPGEGNGYPLQYSGLENSKDCIVHEVAKSWTQLSDFHFHFTPKWAFFNQGSKHSLMCYLAENPSFQVNLFPENTIKRNRIIDSIRTATLVYTQL